MTAAEVEERRLLDAAAIEGQRAARMEAAARGDGGGVGRLALQDRPRAARAFGDLRRLGRRQHADERPRVRVARIVDDRRGRADLQDLAQVHDRDAVGDDPGQREVVGDEQVGQAALLAQVEHQREQLGADGDVEHRDWLVGDHERRPEHERPGDDDPLALAARQLVRVAEQEVRGRPQAGGLERLGDARLAFGRVPGQAVDLERLGDEVADRLLRVERLVGILEDELDAQAVGLGGRALELDRVLALERHPAPGRLGQPYDDPAGRRLAGAGFTDEREDLPLADVEVDAIDGVDEAHGPATDLIDDAAADGEPDLHLAELDEGMTVHGSQRERARERVRGASVIRRRLSVAHAGTSSADAAASSSTGTATASSMGTGTRSPGVSAW